MLSGGLVAAVVAALFVLGLLTHPVGRSPGDHTKGRVLDVVLELWGHFLLVLLCVNVAYDEFVCCPLLWIFVRPLSRTLFHRATTALIEWTTYIVIGPPTAWCGLRAYVNDMEYFQNVVKTRNCLLLSNHGSRIDWLIGMFVGLVQNPIRVGFVCEALIK